MPKEYILLNYFRKAKKGFTAGFHVPLTLNSNWTTPLVTNAMTSGSRVCHVVLLCLHMYVELRPRLKL